MLYRRLVEEHLSDTRPLLTDGQQTLTIARLHERVLCCMAALRSRGAKPGDRILVTDTDPMDTAIVILACIAGGFLCVPVSHRLDPESRNTIVQDCTPVCILDTPVPDMPVSLSRSSHPEQMDRACLPEDTPVYLLYTSGSTGRPRGIVGCQKQILFCCGAIARRLELCREDRILCCLPLSFDYGMYQLFLALFSGASLVLDDGGVLQRIPWLLCHQNITVFPAIPTMARLLLRLRISGSAPALRCMTFTGETLPVPLIQQMQACLPGVRMVPMYGLTECKRVSVMPPGREDRVLAGSCGLPLDGVRVWLDHPDPETGIGELLVSGENVMEGYWKQDSCPTFFTDPETGRRCLRTGDLIRMDEEGFLYFCGRKSDILKIRGYRVSTAWLEERLCPGTSDASDVAVVGCTDPLTGERAAVFFSGDSEEKRKEALARIRQLPDYLWDIKPFFLPGPLPQNRNGKIDRLALQRIAEATS